MLYNRELNSLNSHKFEHFIFTCIRQCRIYDTFILPTFPKSEITSWSRLFHEKHIITQLVKEFLVFCETWRFIAMPWQPITYCADRVTTPLWYVGLLRWHFMTLCPRRLQSSAYHWSITWDTWIQPLPHILFKVQSKIVVISSSSTHISKVTLRFFT